MSKTTPSAALRSHREDLQVVNPRNNGRKTDLLVLITAEKEKNQTGRRRGLDSNSLRLASRMASARACSGAARSKSLCRLLPNARQVLQLVNEPING